MIQVNARGVFMISTQPHTHTPRAMSEYTLIGRHIETAMNRVILGFALVAIVRNDKFNSGVETYFFHLFIVMLVLLYIAYQLEVIIVRWNRTSPPLLDLLYKFIRKLVMLAQYVLTFSLIRVLNARLDGFLSEENFARLMLVAAAVIFALVAVQVVMEQSGRKEVDDRSAEDTAYFVQ